MTKCAIVDQMDSHEMKLHGYHYISSHCEFKIVTLQANAWSDNIEGETIIPNSNACNINDL